MKKLLLILLCFPFIGFGQIADTISEKKENMISNKVLKGNINKYKVIKIVLDRYIDK